MALWFVGLSFVVVVSVFRDAALDYRLVMLGALLPDLADPWLGGAAVMHTLAFSVLLLCAVMVLTRRRRRLRRRLLAVPIGTFVHLVLDGAWARTETFWWPMFGPSFRGEPLPSLQRPLWLLVLMELAGAGALAWAWRRFRLGDPERRRVFVRTGRLDRNLVA